MHTFPTIIQHISGSPSYSNQRRKINKKNPGQKRRSETAKDMMEFLREDITEEQLVQKMLETYDVPEEQLRHDVSELIQKLREAEVLDE